LLAVGAYKALTFFSSKDSYSANGHSLFKLQKNSHAI